MVLEGFKKGLRAFTTSAIYIISGFDSKVADNWLRGSDSESDTNTASKTTNLENIILSDEFIKKVAVAMNKNGDNDGIEKIADLQKNREENIEDWIKRLKGASREEKRRIMDEISDTTRAELEAANKILRDSNRRLEQKQLKSLEEARQAQQNGDTKKAAELFALVDEQEKTIHQHNKIRLQLDKQKKENEKQAKEHEQLTKANQTWYSDINWGSWQVWLVVISALGFGYLIYRMIMWIYHNYLTNWIN